MINRRQVLVSAAGMALMPRMVFGQAVDGVQHVSIQAGKLPLLGPEAAPTDVWQFNQNGAGPVVLHAQQGQSFSCHFANELDREVWLHFFGVRGAAAAMTVLIPPASAEGVTITFTPPDAGTFWFGPFLDASRQRDMGLSGMLIVHEVVALPQFVDVPIMLDDWMVDADGRMDTSFGDLERAIGEGRLGNWHTVNGAYKPRLAIDRSKSNRLRLVNVANARTFAVQFRNVDLIVIAEDGQPVPPRPLGLEPLFVAPGQRVDLLVGTIEDQAIIALDLGVDSVEVAFLLASGQAGEGVAENFALPPNPVPVPPDGVAVPRAVTLTLEGGAKGGLKSATVGTARLDLRQLLERALAWAINGVAGTGGPMLFSAAKGEALMLTIDNKTAFAQPLCLHGHVWIVVEQGGQPVSQPQWRDTLVVGAMAQAKAYLVADNPGVWAIQSLVAERSDAGLVGGFSVADMP